MEDLGPSFMGRKIYRYKVYSDNNAMIYTCVTTDRTEEEIMIHILDKFCQPITVYCNGKRIGRHNVKKRVRKKVRIIDQLENKYYNDVFDMAYQLDISLRKAKELIAKHMRYEKEK